VLGGDRRRMPGAVRASAGIATTTEDIDRFLDALARIAGGEPPPRRFLRPRLTLAAALSSLA